MTDPKKDNLSPGSDNPNKDTQGIPEPPEPDFDKEKGFEKYGAKSWEEVGERYKNLEKKLGEQGNELGDLRKANKTLYGMLEDANLILRKVVEGEEEPPKPDQVARVIQDLHNDPLGVMSAVSSSVVKQEVGEELEAIKKSLTEISARLSQAEIIKQKPEIEKLPKELQNVIFADKIGKITDIILKLAKKQETQTETPPAPGKPSVLQPGLNVKVLNTEQELEEALEKAKTMEDASRIIAASLGEK